MEAAPCRGGQKKGDEAAKEEESDEDTPLGVLAGKMSGAGGAGEEEGRGRRVQSKQDKEDKVEGSKQKRKRGPEVQEEDKGVQMSREEKKMAAFMKR